MFLKEKIYRCCWRLISLACLFPALLGQAAAPEWQRIELGAEAHRYPFAIYSNKAWAADSARVTSAVLVFHGMGRDGGSYYAAAEKLLQASGTDAAETLLIAPNFFAPADARKFSIDGMPVWSRSRWNSGWDADDQTMLLSSFQVIDDLIAALLDGTRFPRLARIVLAGHSAGGQLIHRYAMLNTIDEKVRASGKTLRYVIANPSSYTYFTNERARGANFAPYDASLCPSFNEYRYGLDKMLRYAGSVDGATLFKRYAARNVTYLLGTADNDPNHVQLDKTCGAEAQGAYRLERGRNYIRYERYLAGSTVKLNRQIYEVIGVGHNHAHMIGSQCAATLLFGMPVEKNTDGAACRAPQL